MLNKISFENVFQSTSLRRGFILFIFNVGNLFLCVKAANKTFARKRVTNFCKIVKKYTNDMEDLGLG